MIEIRKATLADAAGMISVLNPIIESGRYSSMRTPYSLADQTDYLATFPAEGIFSVAFDGATLVGLQSIEAVRVDRVRGQCGEISTFVDLARLGEGIGRALAARTLRRARERDFETIIAIVRRDNPLALGYYHALGFVETTERDARDGNDHSIAPFQRATLELRLEG